MSPLDKATRRALSREARDQPPAMGVYALRCRATGYLVVQASLNLDGALNRARFELGLGSHRDRRLQAAWRRGGEVALSFEVLEQVRRRPEPDFDPLEALDTALHLWRAELLPGGGA